MPSDGASIRLSLGVMKAKYLQKKTARRKNYKKLQSLRSTIKKKEEELDNMEEERSESFDSGFSLLQSSGSESEKEEVPQVNKAKAKGPGVPAPAGKPPPAAAVPPPPKPGAPSHLYCLIEAPMGL